MNNAFNENEKEAIYRVIRERRDVRKFKADPIPEEILRRIIAQHRLIQYLFARGAREQHAK